MAERTVKPISEISQETKERLQFFVVMFRGFSEVTRRAFDKLPPDSRVARELMGQEYTWAHAADIIEEELIPPGSNQPGVSRSSVYTQKMLQMISTQQPAETFPSPTLDQIVGTEEDHEAG